MLRENKVKRMIKEGKLALSAHISFAEPALVEVIGFAGVDAVSNAKNIRPENGEITTNFRPG